MNTPATPGDEQRPAGAGDAAIGDDTRARRFSTGDILQAVGAAAGTATVVYVIGGIVMWLRFRKAGLPADQAVALMERQQLLVIGLRLMVLPAALTGALAWLVMHRRSRRSVGLPKRARTVLKAALAILALAFALMLPFSFASATWVLAAVLVLGYLRYERRPAGVEPTRERSHPDEPPRRAPERDAEAGRIAVARARLAAASWWWRERVARVRPLLPLQRRELRVASPLVATVLVVAVAAVVSLGRQFDQPVQLLDSTVRLQDRAQPINGVWISSDSDEVFVGVGDEIKAIPRSTVRDVTLGPPRERAPSPSILSRALGGNRYAITPFDWWCNGERYSWGEVGDLCRTQIEVVHAPGQTVQRPDLAGDAVPVKLHCPEIAERPCRGFLRLSSRNRYRLGPAALPKPITFRSRVRPVGTADTAEAGIAPGQSKVVCVPVDQGQRGLLRNTAPVEDPMALAAGSGKRPLAFHLTVSPDEPGRNIVRSERYFINVTRPGQPIEYWGECATLRISCRAEAGSGARDAVGCAITGARRFTGRLTVVIVSGATRYARSTGQVDAKQLRVSPRVSRPLQLGVRYQAVALLEKGGSARTFWDYFRAHAPP